MVRIKKKNMVELSEVLSVAAPKKLDFAAAAVAAGLVVSAYGLKEVFKGRRQQRRERAADEEEAAAAAEIVAARARDQADHDDSSTSGSRGGNSSVLAEKTFSFTWLFVLCVPTSFSRCLADKFFQEECCHCFTPCIVFVTSSSQEAQGKAALAGGVWGRPASSVTRR